MVTSHGKKDVSFHNMRQLGMREGFFEQRIDQAQIGIKKCSRKSSCQIREAAKKS